MSESCITRITDTNSMSLPEAAHYYRSVGWSILQLQPKSKRAYNPNWSQSGYSDDAYKWDIHPTDNIGLHLGPSQMLVIDIDDTAKYTAARDAIADTLRKQFSYLPQPYWEVPTLQISSGRAGSGKYVYRIPDGISLPLRKLWWADADGKRQSVVEFRCGDGFQDVLPPSIHPGGTTYQWTGETDTIAEVPIDLLYMLLSYWDDTYSPLMQMANPDYHEPKSQIVTKSGKRHNGPALIQQWNDMQHLPTLLSQYGYTPAGAGRMLSPHSSSGDPGVVFYEGGSRFYCHHASDPYSDGHSHDAYDVIVMEEFGGDTRRAFIERVLPDLGIDYKPNRVAKRALYNTKYTGY